jgi:hypothetical protein
MGEDRGRRSSANNPIKASWRNVVVRCANGLELAGEDRLVALMHWLRGEGAFDQKFFDPLRERVLTDPMTVNWARFPLQEATAAVAAEEGRTSGVHMVPARREPGGGRR